MEGSTTTIALGLTYWTDEGLTGNQILMKHYELLIPSGTFLSAGPLTKAQVACPGLGADYIGDYDAMIVGNNATATPYFNRLFTGPGSGPPRRPTGGAGRKRSVPPCITPGAVIARRAA